MTKFQINLIVILLFQKRKSKSRMHQPLHLKKQNDGQLNLYRLMRLQNRQNNFIYSDQNLNIQFRVNYQHFPLQTINNNDLLKTFWKFITTHHFKKIDQEELYKIKYLKELFKDNVNECRIPNLFHLSQSVIDAFSKEMSQIIKQEYLQGVFRKNKVTFQDSLYLKKMLIAWASDFSKKNNKTKKIVKLQTKKSKHKTSLIKMKQQEKELNQLINQIDFLQQTQMINKHLPNEDIDAQIKRLQLSLLKTQSEMSPLISSLQQNLQKQQLQLCQQQQKQTSGEDASCIQWLLHILQQKQIAQSVTKVISCQRTSGESKFLINLQTAMNISPHLLSQNQLKRINLLRQVSLFKFYKTGVKSIYSYACHNSAGLVDMHQNRMNLAKYKDKDYMQVMKKGFHLNAETKQSIQQFDVCHHCKYIYPNNLLTTCKFISDRQTMPKTSQIQTDLHADTNLQKGRISQRFISKHRNCFNGYAKINEEYICGRKFCKSCLKDCYGKQWIKNNNGLCPFCLAVCSCTRCLRHQKMNKLKSFFMSLGGDLNKLQEYSQIQRLPIRKDEIFIKTKPKFRKQNKMKYSQREDRKIKTKMIFKQNGRKYASLSQSYGIQKRGSRVRSNECDRQMIDEQTQRWSSTAQKQLNNLIGRRASKRRILTKLY